MSIHQSKKQSDLEKRLQLLRRQVYGNYQIPRLNQDNKLNLKNGQQTTKSYSIPDITYLYHDLFKIFIFASIAIGIQIMLFLLEKNNVFTLNSF